MPINELLLHEFDREMSSTSQPKVEVEEPLSKRVGHKARIASMKGIMTRRTNGG